VVLEVGLGGRLDATNVVDAEVAVVTGVALDHQEILGGDVAAIAREKAGIFKPGRVAIIGAGGEPEAIPVLVEEARARGRGRCRRVPSPRGGRSGSAASTSGERRLRAGGRRGAGRLRGGAACRPGLGAVAGAPRADR
jgi:folylpolyglutamate synthase/dihydropteroate synthase